MAQVQYRGVGRRTIEDKTHETRYVLHFTTDFIVQSLKWLILGKK